MDVFKPEEVIKLKDKFEKRRNHVKTVNKLKRREVCVNFEPTAWLVLYFEAQKLVLMRLHCY